MPEYNLDLEYNDITYVRNQFELNPAFLIAAISPNVVLRGNFIDLALTTATSTLQK
jgi:hypothetical protein